MYVSDDCETWSQRLPRGYLPSALILKQRVAVQLTYLTSCCPTAFPSPDVQSLEICFKSLLQTHIRAEFAHSQSQQAFGFASHDMLKLPEWKVMLKRSQPVPMPEAELYPPWSTWTAAGSPESGKRPPRYATIVSSCTAGRSLVGDQHHIAMSQALEPDSITLPVGQSPCAQA